LRNDDIAVLYTKARDMIPQRMKARQCWAGGRAAEDAIRKHMADILHTARLRLRPLTLDDLDDMCAIWSDPETMRYYPAPYSRARVEELLRFCLERYREHGYCLWAMVRNHDDVFIGDCGPLQQPVAAQTMIEVGYHTNRRYWGQGYATEAARACCSYVLHTLKAPQVVSIVHPQNSASRRVAEKVHMHMRYFFWEKAGREMCLYSTPAP
jgi:RimJ/RimL family protein N-acetyltransferase